MCDRKNIFQNQFYGEVLLQVKIYIFLDSLGPWPIEPWPIRPIICGLSGLDDCRPFNFWDIFPGLPARV